VNVGDNGKTTSPCGAISTAQPQASGTQANSISTDGSHVFFLSPNPLDRRCFNERGGLAPSRFTGTPPQLYLRVGGHTIWVSEPEKGVVDPDGPQIVGFAGASASGSRVWFITRGELTADDLALGNHEPELYEYNAETGHLTRISAGDSHDAVGSVGWVVPSEDGSTVYFTAAGQLAPGAARLNTIQPGEESPLNLYRYDTETATTTYIATVSGLDWFSSTAGGVDALNVRLPLNVRSDWQTTPNGGFLLFDSTADITGYDPEDRTGLCKLYIGGDRSTDGNCAEVYRYDAATNSVVCVSCNPDGASPTTGALFDGNTNSRELRAISNNGAYVFFNTNEPLSDLATDEQLNVYEWHEGEISLISSGQDSSPSFFLGTDASGADVFFGTHSQLVPEDTDNEGDLYDARIDGGFAALRGSAACEGDACQAPPAPPDEQTPASSTFSGAGNGAPGAPPAPGKPLVEKAAKCPRGKVRGKHGKCVKKKAKKAKKSIRRGK
jgi:dipeptidyl aminopeptidase/acylaminoacyl peptidase